MRTPEEITKEVIKDVLDDERWSVLVIIKQTQDDAIAHGREIGLREAAEIIRKEYPSITPLQYHEGMAWQRDCPNQIAKTILSAINKKVDA
jgi:hypothetical protein